MEISHDLTAGRTLYIDTRYPHFTLAESYVIDNQKHTSLPQVLSFKSVATLGGRTDQQLSARGKLMKVSFSTSQKHCHENLHVAYRAGWYIGSENQTVLRGPCGCGLENMGSKYGVIVMGPAGNSHRIQAFTSSISNHTQGRARRHSVQL